MRGFKRCQAKVRNYYSRNESCQNVATIHAVVAPYTAKYFCAVHQHRARSKE